MIGTAHVVKQGLYYNIRCRFKSRMDRKMHLLAVSPDGVFDMGTCSWHGREIGIDRILPIKTIGNIIKKFCVSTDNYSYEISVRTGMAFPVIDQLMNSVLVVRPSGIKIKICYST